MSLLDSISEAIHARKDDLAEGASGRLLDELAGNTESVARYLQLSPAQAEQLQVEVGALREEHADDLAHVSRFGLGLLAAGLASHEADRGLQAWLEHSATFEQRQQAILGAAGQAVASEAERQQRAQAALAALERIGKVTLRVIALAAVRAGGIAL